MASRAPGSSVTVMRMGSRRERAMPVSMVPSSKAMGPCTSVT